MPIVFSVLLGNLIPGTPYYINSINTSPPYITVSATSGGSVFTTGTESASSPAIVYSISSLVSAVSGTTITVNHSDGIIIGMPVVFSANIGNIIRGTLYYVQASGGNNGTTMSISATLAGPVFTVGSGSGSVRANFFNLTSAPAYYKIQQGAILSGMNVTMATPANSSGSAVTIQFGVYRTPAGVNPQTGIFPVNNFSLTFNDSTTATQSYYNTSQTFNSGDKINVLLTYYGGSPNAHDIAVQLDMF